MPSAFSVGFAFLAASASMAALPGSRTDILTSGQARTVPVSEGFATSPDGARVYYRVAGSGDEVVIAPFALFHGTALDRLAKGRRIVTYDPRGRGKSGAVALDKVSLDGLLSDLDTVRRAVRAERVAIIGWSGGGMETFVYALRNPGKVSRLVHFAPVAPRIDPYGELMMQDRSKRTDSAALVALEERRKAGVFASDPAAHCRERAKITRVALFHDVAKAALPPDVCIYPNEHPERTGPYFGALFRSIAGYDWRDELAQVTIPRLVIHPLQDNIPLAGNEEWVRGQPNARIMVIDGSGHYPHYEQPEQTLEALATFLDGEWPAASRALPAQ